jgi:hypothetical protein
LFIALVALDDGSAVNSLLEPSRWAPLRIRFGSLVDQTIGLEAVSPLIVPW